MKKKTTKQQETTVSEFFIAGLVHHDFDASNGKLPRNAVLTLKAEPGNPYDANAIEVYHGKTKLGYVPRDQTDELHAYREAGIAVRATVKQFARTNPTHRMVLVKVAARTTISEISDFKSY